MTIEIILALALLVWLLALLPIPQTQRLTPATHYLAWITTAILAASIYLPGFW